MGDLKSARVIYLKAALFLICGLLAAGLLIIESPGLRTLTLLSVAVWSFCRCYYFAFYVIEHYVSREYRFSGLADFAAYCLHRKRP